MSILSIVLVFIEGLVRYKIPTAVKMTITVFWNMTPYSLEYTHMYQTKRRQLTEDNYLLR
jgi:hypothetical protein